MMYALYFSLGAVAGAVGVLWYILHGWGAS